MFDEAYDSLKLSLWKHRPPTLECLLWVLAVRKLFTQPGS